MLIATCSSSVFLGLVFLIFLMTLPHRTFVEFRPGEFAGQSSTVISWLANHLVVVQALWAGAKSCWTKKWTSPWSLSSDPGTQLRWLWTKSSRSSWWHGILNQTVETSHWTSSVLFACWMLISQQLTMSTLLFPSLPHFSSCFLFSVRKHEWQLRWRLIPGDGLRLHCPAHTCFPLPSMPDLWPTQPQSLRVTESCLRERWRVSGMRELIWTSMPDLLPEENKRVYCCGKHSQQLLFNKLIFYILWYFISYEWQAHSCPIL